MEVKTICNQIYGSDICDKTNCKGCDISFVINNTLSVIGTSANDYQEKAKKTINKLNLLEMETHALHGMCGEIGEIHSIYQKLYQGHTLDYEHLKKEVGDLLWFIAEYCTACGWKLSDIMDLNISKLQARYPDGFSTEKSLHRKEGDI